MTKFTIQDFARFVTSKPHLRALDVSLQKRVGAPGWKMTYISPVDNRERSTIIRSAAQGLSFISALMA